MKELGWKFSRIIYTSELDTPWDVEVPPEGPLPRRRCPFSIYFQIDNYGDKKDYWLSIYGVLKDPMQASSRRSMLKAKECSSMKEAKTEARTWLEAFINESEKEPPSWMIFQILR